MILCTILEKLFNCIFLRNPTKSRHIKTQNRWITLLNSSCGSRFPPANVGDDELVDSDGAMKESPPWKACEQFYGRG
jgi:hypothetical protein